MEKSQPVQSPVAADLLRVLNGYLGGQLTIEGFLAWEAERSLDAGTADTLRVVLDRLSIVAAEVCDGVRDDGEFRALAREVLTGTLEAARVAVAETPGSYRVSDTPE